MTQEEKQLLLKDLCARLPYGVVLYTGSPYGGNWTELISIDTSSEQVMTLYNGEVHSIEEVKPYLRPMSSMTEEEKKKLKEETCPNGTGLFDKHYLICPVNHYGEQISFEFMSDIINWLNAHHFDFRGLIEKGLALEASEGMYKTE